MKKNSPDVFPEDKSMCQSYNLALAKKTRRLKRAFLDNFLSPIVPYPNDCGLSKEIFSIKGIYLASSNFTNKLKELYGFRYEY